MTIVFVVINNSLSYRATLFMYSRKLHMENVWLCNCYHVNQYLMRICVYVYIIIAPEFTHYPSCQLKVIWLFIGLHTLNHGTTSPAVTAGFSYDFRWKIKP